MPTAVRRKSPTADVPPFDEHLRAAVQAVRAALAEVSASVGADATRPQGLARQLGLDKSLAWHISKVLTEDDLLATVSHLPGRSGNRIMLRAFEKAGASEHALESLRGALAEFERMVEVHCGDRDTLLMMLGRGAGAGGGADDHARQETYRRKLVQGASAIWGVQARVHLAAHFVAPARDGNGGNNGRERMLDLAIMCGLIDLRRLRSDVPWAVASVQQFTGDGQPHPPDVWEPVDADVAQDDVPLMREFCSQPLPPLRTAPGLPGVTRYEIIEGPVGNTAAMTCIAGWINRRCVSGVRTEEDRFGEHMVTISTPAELLVYDLFVHRDCNMLLPPEFDLYSQLPGGPAYPQAGRERGRLPGGGRDAVLELGGGTSGSAAGSAGGPPPDVIVPEIPRYPLMVERVFARLGWTARDFAGYRVKMRYPPIPTLGVLRYLLPEG